MEKIDIEEEGHSRKPFFLTISILVIVGMLLAGSIYVQNSITFWEDATKLSDKFWDVWYGPPADIERINHYREMKPENSKAFKMKNG